MPKSPFFSSVSYLLGAWCDFRLAFYFLGDDMLAPFWAFWGAMAGLLPPPPGSASGPTQDSSVRFPYLLLIQGVLLLLQSGDQLPKGGRGGSCSRPTPLGTPARASSPAATGHSALLVRGHHCMYTDVKQSEMWPNLNRGKTTEAMSVVSISLDYVSPAHIAVKTEFDLSSGVSE